MHDIRFFPEGSWGHKNQGRSTQNSNDPEDVELINQLAEAKARIAELEGNILKAAEFVKRLEFIPKTLECAMAMITQPGIAATVTYASDSAEALQTRIDAAVEVLILSMAGKSSPTQAVADAVIILERDENKPTDACELIAVKRMLSKVLSKLGGE